MTAYMEALDNFFRMMQQVGLRQPLAWFDWVAAAGLGLCVAFQGCMHYASGTLLPAPSSVINLPSTCEAPPPTKASAPTVGARSLAGGESKLVPEPAGAVITPVKGIDSAVASGADLEPVSALAAGNGAANTPSQAPRRDNVAIDVKNSTRPSPAKSAADPNASSETRKVFAFGLDKERFVIVLVGGVTLIVGSPILALLGGPTGQAYVFATLATAAKTFANLLSAFQGGTHPCVTLKKDQMSSFILRRKTH